MKRNVCKLSNWYANEHVSIVSNENVILFNEEKKLCVVIVMYVNFITDTKNPINSTGNDEPINHKVTGEFK